MNSEPVPNPKYSEPHRVRHYNEPHYVGLHPDDSNSKNLSHYNTFIGFIPSWLKSQPKHDVNPHWLKSQPKHDTDLDHSDSDPDPDLSQCCSQDQSDISQSPCHSLDRSQLAESRLSQLDEFDELCQMLKKDNEDDDDDDEDEDNVIAPDVASTKIIMKSMATSMTGVDIMYDIDHNIKGTGFRSISSNTTDTPSSVCSDNNDIDKAKDKDKDKVNGKGDDNMHKKVTINKRRVKHYIGTAAKISSLVITAFVVGYKVKGLSQAKN